MKNPRKLQRELGEVRIEDIELDNKSRDDIPALLFGLQYLYSQDALRDRLFSLMDEYILPVIDEKAERPDMEMWRILVMGVVKQGLGCNFDMLHDLVNEHRTIREFLGHFVKDDRRYHYQTLVDNVSLLNPKLFQKVNQLIVESGNTLARKKAWRALARAL